MLKQMPHLQKNRIHGGRSKFHGFVLYLPFNFCYAVIYLQIEVGPIIIGLVAGAVSVLEDKWGYVVELEKM